MLRILLAVLLIFFIQVDFAASIVKNPKETVTLVEYYDYECPHCRKMAPVIESLQKEYSNLRVIYRVTPLLLPASRAIASIVLTANRKNKNIAVKIHRMLMHFNTRPRVTDAIRIATALGFSPNILFSAIKNKTVQNQINQNITLANTYAINGMIYLPILVFSTSNGKSIVLRGEESRALLSAVVRELGESNAAVVTEKKEEEQSS